MSRRHTLGGVYGVYFTGSVPRRLGAGVSRALKLVGHGLYAAVMLLILRAQESLAVGRAISAENRLSQADGTARQVWTRARRRQLVGEVRAELLAEDRTTV